MGKASVAFWFAGGPCSSVLPLAAEAFVLKRE